MGRFDGARVIVTGAGSGFGLTTARKFAAEGAATLVLSDLRPERVTAAKQEIEQLGARAIGLPGDVGDPDVCDAIVDAMVTAAGGVDVLISNAAPFHPQGFGQHGESDTRPVDRSAAGWPPSVGRRCHLGVRIKFSDLPEDCRTCALRDYKYYWGLEETND